MNCCRVNNDDFRVLLKAVLMTASGMEFPFRSYKEMFLYSIYGRDTPGFRLSLNSCGLLRIIRLMSMRIRQSLAMVLILALTLSGLQFAVPGVWENAGSDDLATLMTSVSMDHDCADCNPQDCCATQTCQMTTHCVSFPAVIVSANLNGQGGKSAHQLAMASPIVPSTLIPSIYRPPWA
jgi:hypothetical protein